MALRSPGRPPTSEDVTVEEPGRWPETVSAEIVTEEGDEVKDDEEVEVDVVERAESSLGDDARPDESSKAKMLFTMLRGMWTKPSKKRTEKTTAKISKSPTTVMYCSQRRKAPKKMADRTQHEGKKLSVPRIT